MNRFFLYRVFLTALLLATSLGAMAQQAPAGGGGGAASTTTGGGGASGAGSTSSGLQSESKILLYDGIAQGLGKLVGKIKLSFEAGHPGTAPSFMVTLPTFSADDVASCWEFKRQLAVLDDQLADYIATERDLDTLAPPTLPLGGASGTPTPTSSGTTANPSIDELSGLGADFTQFGAIASATSTMLQLANTFHSNYTVAEGDLGLDQPTVTAILINQLAKRHLTVYDYTQAYLTEEDYLGVNPITTATTSAATNPNDPKALAPVSAASAPAPAGPTRTYETGFHTLIDLVSTLHEEIGQLNDWQTSVTNRNTNVAALLSAAYTKILTPAPASGQLTPAQVQQYQHLQRLLNLTAVLTAAASVEQAIEGPIAYKTPLAQPLASNPGASANTANGGDQRAPGGNGAAAAAFTNIIVSPPSPAPAGTVTNAASAAQPASPAPVASPTTETSQSGSVTLAMADGGKLTVALPAAASATNPSSPGNTATNNNANLSVPLTSPINIVEKYRVIEAWAKKMATTHTYLISARVLVSNATQTHVSRYVLEDYIALSARNVLQVQVFDIFKARYRYSDDFENYRQYVYFPSRVRDGAENKWKDEDTLTNDRTDSHETLQWLNSLAAAEAVATKQGKDILMETAGNGADYSRSSFENALNNNNELRTFAAEHLVLLRVRPGDMVKHIDAAKFTASGPDSLPFYRTRPDGLPLWSLIEPSGEIRLRGGTVDDSDDLLDELQSVVTP